MGYKNTRQIKYAKHCDVYTKGPDRTIIRKRVKVVSRAPIRVSSYTAAERAAIIELLILFSIEKFEGHAYLNTASVVQIQLYAMRSRELTSSRVLMRFSIHEIETDLYRLRLFEGSRNKGYRLTERGRKHIKRQTSRVRKAAEKIAFTDVLDRLARVTNT